jgi:hypothetical protein
MRVEQRAELVAFPADELDDFDPDALTESLGVRPTTVHRKGDVLESGRVRPFNMWMWETPERVEPDSEVLVREVLERFEPVAGRLAEAGTRWGLSFQVGLVISTYGSTGLEPEGTPGAVVPAPALYLSSETLRRLSALDCALDVDTYVVADE